MIEIDAKEVMTPENERWRDFVEKLGGKEGCNFEEKTKGYPNSVTWNCSSKPDRPLAKAILEKMGNVDIPETMKYFHEHGGHCDCEILFNVDC
jgi:hypothetical protein